MVLNRNFVHIRKLATYLVAVAVVKWTLIFGVTYDAPKYTQKRERAFESEKEARNFAAHAPKGLFECVNSLTAMPGMCEVKDVQLTIMRDPFKDFSGRSK